jgi:hypothetical protein
MNFREKVLKPSKKGRNEKNDTRNHKIGIVDPFVKLRMERRICHKDFTILLHFVSEQFYMCYHPSGMSFAPVRIFFNAIPFPFFSAASELRNITYNDEDKALLMLIPLLWRNRAQYVLAV